MAAKSQRRSRQVLMSDPDYVALAARIAREEARLSELAAEQAEVTARLTTLKAQLPTAPDSASPSPELTRTNAEKIALFRSLFRGRTDLFPKYWHNTKKGRKGYAPACANEWVHGICEKPRVKCGECPNQDFLAVTDQIIGDHLRGRHVAGVYPLLADETCWFLALDFDKGDWQADVAAFKATAQRFDLDPAVERSRSGAGAHVWFFFSEPVPANAARNMGCYLITETMARRDELPMSSYDRFFPSQDTMPRGGFGNLIALPLQHEFRQQGNTLFVDENWIPYPDQWIYLASITRLKAARIHELARAAEAADRVMGARRWDSEEETAGELSLERPSWKGKVPLDGPLPAGVRCVLDSQLIVDKEGLPPIIINQIKRLAAFQNPEFYKKQGMRLSTALTPRVISCVEEDDTCVALPRGCLQDLAELLEGYGVVVSVDDRRTDGKPFPLQFHGELTPLQQQAVRALLDHDIGVFVAPPGIGKTVVGTQLVASRGRATLVLVHRTQLLDQWRAQLSVFLDLKPSAIGQIGGGRRKVTGHLDIAMIQSLVRRDKVDDVVAEYGHVLVDECHHVPAVSFERVMLKVQARYITGLTATPVRRDGHHPILHYQLGPVRFAVDPVRAAARRPFSHRLQVRRTTFRLKDRSDGAGIQAIYAQLSTDSGRNEMILDDVIGSLEQGRSPILLTERRDHLHFFAEQLRSFTRHLVLLKGGMGARQRREVTDQLKSIPDGEERLILATGRFIGEGFDDARLDTLFLAMPVSWKGTLVQYVGRLHRQHALKSEVRVFDYVDGEVPMLARMFEKRLKGYQSMGYVMADSADRSGARAGDYVVEYEDEEPTGGERESY